MLDVLAYLFAVLVAIVVVIGGIVGLVYLAGLVTRVLTRTRQDPEFGPVSYFAGVCTFSVQIGRQKRVEVNLPGSKSTIDADAADLFRRIKKNWPKVEAEFLERFAEEIVEFAQEGIPLEAVTTAQSRDKAALRNFTTLDNLSVERDSDGKQIRAWVSFLHDWDPEHSRSLIVEQDMTFTDYGMTVGM